MKIFKEIVLLGCDFRPVIKAVRSSENSETNHLLVQRRIPELSIQPHSHEPLQKRKINNIKIQQINKQFISLTTSMEIKFLPLKVH